MKTKYLLILIIFFSLGSSLALAQTSDTGLRGDREAMQMELKEERDAHRAEMEAQWAEADAQREARREEFEARRAEFQANRIEFQQEVVERKVERTVRVMLATIERLERIGDRIESRIGKIKDRGGETAESEGYLASARVNLSEARETVELFSSLDLTSDEAPQNFERIRELAVEVREHLRSAHRNLMLAVRSLRALEVETDSEPNEADDE